MHLLLELLIATRFLRSKRKDTFISVVTIFSLLGTALGVATLIVVMSVMNGYHNEFLRNILGIQGHLTAVSSGGKFLNYIEFSDQVEKISAVEFAAPIIVEQGMFLVQDRASGGIVRGIEPQKLYLKPSVRDVITPSAMQKFIDGEGVLVGVALAKQLGAKVGSTIKIITAELSSTMVGSIPRSKNFRVIGVFDVGLYQYNSTTIFMPLREAQNLYKFPNSVSEVEIMVHNPEKLQEIKDEIYDFAGPSIHLMDWEAAQEKWLSALKIERNVMFLILTLIILVAAFNIISGLIMLVKDKAKSIGILRTMGMQKSSMIRIFMMCGGLVGGTGTFTGTLLGIIVATNIENLRVWLQNLTGSSLFDPVVYFLTHLPSELHITDVLLIISFSLIVCLLATIYPAYRASKLLPADILRYE
jgi:lipoprotein-releasing system permease protein